VDYPSPEWDENDYAEALRKLTKKADDGTIEMLGGFLPPNSQRLWPHVRAWGGNFTDEETRTKCLLREDPAQEALEWIRSLMWDENVIAQQLQVEDMNGYEALMNERVAMA
jgi:ABC-type glycerol-3-phosphate transport system substrate-binding protein